ncbi:MAG: trypsin-like peptidase domain-containing protein [Pirellulales bacterium]
MPAVLAGLASPAMAVELVEVVKRVENAVVRVETDRGLGSGVVVDDRGYVFTNFHVIDGAKKVTVTLRSGKALKALGFVAIDPGRDLALLKTDPLEPCGIRIAGSPPEIGEKVAAFGNPRGYSFSTTEGIVSAVRTGKEVVEAVGEESYRSLGFSPDARWIQTSAAISGGNSGGPLVNMNAEVVGLNTWSDQRGDNLNFAISAADMRLLIAKIKGKSVTDFAKLPKGAHVDGGDNLSDDKFRVTLPTGRVFSFGVFGSRGLVDVLESATEEEDTSELVTVSHANGTPYAAVCHVNGVMNGTTIGQHENRELMLMANYEVGKRHGVLRLFDEAGEPLLLAQYAKGRRHGFLCLFESGAPALLVDYKYDKPTWIQLLHGFAILEGFASIEEANKNTKAREQLERLEKVEATLKSHEVLFRKHVASEEQERRKELARQLAPEKRARIQERASQRAAQNQAFIQGLYRAAYGR